MRLTWAVLVLIALLVLPTFGQNFDQTISKLMQQQTENVSSLLKDLKSDNPQIRWGAQTYLSIMAEGNRAARTSLIKLAVEPLIQDLKDNNSDVRTSAANVLGTPGLKDTRAVEPLIQVLKTNYNVSDDGRPCAAIALGYVNDTRAVEPLIQALNDKHANVRLCAAQALGMIKNTRAVEPLIHALKDSNWFVRMSASLALGNINDTRAIEPLIPLLKEDNDNVRQNAEIALENLGWQPNSSEGNVPYGQSFISLGASQGDPSTGRYTCGCIPGGSGMLCPSGASYQWL